MVIEKSLFDELKNPDVLKREYDRIIALICERIDEIWKFICKTDKKQLVWYDFDNGVDGRDGDFDPELYEDDIQFRGEYICKEPYKYGFPTELLWDKDWQNTIKNEVAKEKEEMNKRKEQKARNQLLQKEKQERKRKIRENLKKKLTKEELAAVGIRK